MEKLTEKQQALLDEIGLSIEKNGYSPTIRDLVETNGSRSSGGVYKMLQIIKTKGHISMEPGKSRTIKVIKNDSRKDEP